MQNDQSEGAHIRLTRERQRLKLTQGAVAAATGISTATLVGYEQGLRSPAAEYTVRLRALGFDLHYLLLGVTSSDFAADTLDWSLLGHIAAAIFDWCVSREFEIQPEKFGEVLRVIYNDSRRRPDEEFDIARVLKMVA